jgi:hypothetical protein
MGKNDNKGKSKGGYSHPNKKENANARESNERRIQKLKDLEIKRLENIVDKLKSSLRNYIPPNKRLAPNEKAPTIDPRYNLKGAARPALEFYKDPNFDYTEIIPENLFEKLKGNLYEHDEGCELLHNMMDLSVALHNTTKRSKEGIEMFKEMLEYDKNDTLLVRHQLLRIYLDMGFADRAREILDNNLHDKHSLFTYSRPFIEHIALLLDEEDASTTVRDELLMKAYETNPYALWALVYHEYFCPVVEKGFDSIRRKDESTSSVIVAEPGSVGDALSFFEVDLDLWLDTDEVMEWLKSFVVVNKLSPPKLDMPIIEENDDDSDDYNSENDDFELGDNDGGDNDVYEEEENEKEAPNLVDFDTKKNPKLDSQFIRMYNTAIDTALAIEKSSKHKKRKL